MLAESLHHLDGAVNLPYCFRWCPTLVSVDSHPTSDDKVLLAMESAKVAKRVTIIEDGIGEDLSFNLLAWRGDQLTAICQLSGSLMNESPDARLSRTVEVAILCRTGFEATSLTFVAEGYCATDPSQIDPSRPLAAQFVENPAVRECLTITHLDGNEARVVSLPYTYEVGRKVRFDTPVEHPSRQTSNKFLTRLLDILASDVPPAPIDDETWQDVTADQISALGFHVHHSIDMDDLP